MKKRLMIWGVILCVAAVAVTVVSLVYNSWLSDKADYYYTLNDILRGCDFDTARLGDGSIILYDADGNVTDTIKFGNRHKSMDPKYIRNEDGALFFVERGSVDDEIGTVFINGASIGILDGIHSLERIGGNSFRYDTRK